jgi:virginiamycin B lyase
VYVSDPGASQIAKISQGGKVRLFEYSDTVNPTGVVAATDGSMWFFDGSAGRIGRLTSGGKTTFFTLPTEFLAGISPPYDLVAGVNGDAWFSGQAEVGHIDSAGKMSFFNLTDFDEGSAQEFVVGPGGDASFLTGGEISLGTNAPSEIGHIDPAGTLEKISTGDVTPGLIAIGPGGDLYFAGSDSQYNTVLGSVTPGGVVSTVGITFGITQMLTGRDGSLWMDTDGGSLVHVATGLEPEVVGNSVFSPVVTQTSDGSIWFATSDANPLGRIGPSGAMSEYSVPVNPGEPALESIVSDGAGNLWGVSGQSGVVPGLVVFHINVHGSLLTSANTAGILPGPARQVATFVAGNATAGDFGASVKWPDGTITAGTIQSLDSGEFAVTSAARHPMADGSASVKIIDRRNGRTATASAPIVGDLPTPTGTPVDFQATVGVPFTLTLADFSNVLPGENFAIYRWNRLG